MGGTGVHKPISDVTVVSKVNLLLVNLVFEADILYDLSREFVRFLIFIQRSVFRIPQIYPHLFFIKTDFPGRSLVY